MNLTTSDRMRAWMDEGQITEKPRLLENMITSLSSKVERLLGRHAEATSRTVYADVVAAQRVLWVKGYPITSVTSVIEDVARDFTGSAISTDDYDLTTQAKDLGRLEFDFDLQQGPSAVQVIYTGGMAATTAAFIAAYPDISMGMEAQLFFNWQNTAMVGLDGRGGGQVSSSVRKQINFVTWWRDFGDLVPELVQAIKEYRSPAMLQRI